jgi:cell division protein FtsL
MSIDLEYAIKADIRNNPVIREADRRERREFQRIMLLACLAVGLLLFSAWQHFETLRYGYSIEELRRSRAKEESLNRQLRLNLETLRAPQKIEERARRELGLTAPSAAETIIIERTRSSAPPSGVVAQAR